jgi:hypothetical protein
MDTSSLITAVLRRIGAAVRKDRPPAEYHLYRGERERAGQAGQATRGVSPVKELRRAMADAHPDRGGTSEQFIQARRRYQTALGS